jgi:REP element-mobilizing transposase RayT
MREQARFGFMNRGGVRLGAGRKRTGDRKRVEHATRPRQSARTPVHVTLRLASRLPSLRARAHHRRVLECLAAGSKSGFRVVHYVALSNHVHLVCEANDATSLSRGIQGLCVRLARGLNRMWLRRGSVFDDRFHARPLRTPREVRNALNYVLQNAVKHGIALARGLDPCSSARWFDGWRIAIEGAHVESPLQSARTWLLRIGWRRWGLLEPAAHRDS